MKVAESNILKYIQGKYFQEDLKSLNNGSSVSEISCIRKLNPFFDSSGILRVGGRLENSQCSYDARHPNILPSKCYLLSNIKFQILQLNKKEFEKATKLVEDEEGIN